MKTSKQKSARKAVAKNLRELEKLFSNLRTKQNAERELGAGDTAKLIKRGAK